MGSTAAFSGKSLQNIKRTNSRHTQRHPAVWAFILVLAAAIIFTGVLAVGASSPRRSESGNMVRYFETITVKPGDSLWSIAETYRGDDYSLQGYIRELREMNDISGDTIYAGQRLLITYRAEG